MGSGGSGGGLDSIVRVGGATGGTGTGNFTGSTPVDQGAGNKNSTTEVGTAGNITSTEDMEAYVKSFIMGAGASALAGPAAGLWSAYRTYQSTRTDQKEEMAEKLGLSVSDLDLAMKHNLSQVVSLLVEEEEEEDKGGSSSTGGGVSGPGGMGGNSGSPGGMGGNTGGEPGFGGREGT